MTETWLSLHEILIANTPATVDISMDAKHCGVAGQEQGRKCSFRQHQLYTREATIKGTWKLA